MRLRQRLKLISLLSMSSGLIVVILGAAPVPSSYSTVEKSVGRIRQTWSGASGDAQSQATQGGWNKLGDALLNDLRAYSKAPSNAARLDALKQIEEISSELGTLSWQPAIELREAVQQWLRPRLHVAEASRLVKDTLASLPPSTIRPSRATARDGLISSIKTSATPCAITTALRLSPSVWRLFVEFDRRCTS